MLPLDLTKEQFHFESMAQLCPADLHNLWPLALGAHLLALLCCIDSTFFLD